MFCQKELRARGEGDKEKGVSAKALSANFPTRSPVRFRAGRPRPPFAKLAWHLSLEVFCTTFSRRN